MAEVPAIHMNFPEYRLLNEEFQTGLLIEDLEADTIVQAVRSLLEDPSTYQRLKNNCRKAKAVLNWAQESEKLLALFQKNYPL